jgi:hypothetical protein
VAISYTKKGSGRKRFTKTIEAENFKHLWIGDEGGDGDDDEATMSPFEEAVEGIKDESTKAEDIIAFSIDVRRVSL